MIARGFASISGALILSAVAHVTVMATGGYGTPHSYLTLAIRIRRGLWFGVQRHGFVAPPSSTLRGVHRGRRGLWRHANSQSAGGRQRTRSGAAAGTREELCESRGTHRGCRGQSEHLAHHVDPAREGGSRQDCCRQSRVREKRRERVPRELPRALADRKSTGGHGGLDRARRSGKQQERGGAGIS